MSTVIVLVAGVDYPRYQKDRGSSGKVPRWKLRPAGQDWFLPRAFTYAGFALKKHKADAIVLYDVARGRVSAFSRMSDGNRPLQAELLLEVAPVAESNYRRIVRQGDHEEDSLLVPLQDSIVAPERDKAIVHCPAINLVERDRTQPTRIGDYIDSFQGAGSRKGVTRQQLPLGTWLVYKQIQEQKPDTRELHFFSHSFPGGPILTNSVRFGARERKSPLDSDGRLRDFLAPNLDKPDTLRRRFTGDATCVVWGCAVARPWRDRIRRVLKATRQDRSVAVDFEFEPDDWEPPSLKGKRDAFADFFGEPVLRNGTTLVSRPFSRGEFAQILQTKLLPRTYVQALGVATGVPTFGALPGTSANFDDDGESLRLLHVPQGRSDDKNRPDRNDVTGIEPDKLSLLDVLGFYRDEFKKLPGTLTFDLGARLALGDARGEFHPQFGRGFGRFSAK